jgi:hypothetical protein
MSGGSNDDAVLAIGHSEGRIVIVDLVARQIGQPPFDPRSAVKRFCTLLAQYSIKRVTGDAYAGQTFRQDFQREGITYVVGGMRSASDLYESFEPKLNAGEIELLDEAALTEQLICLVWRGGKITHEPGAHDDYANSVAGLVHVLASGSNVVMAGPILITASSMGTFSAPSGFATDWLRHAGAVEGNGHHFDHRRFDYPGGGSW